MGSGRGRPAAFVPGAVQHGVAIEFTELAGTDPDRAERA
jgi:hypothetical protein